MGRELAFGAVGRAAVAAGSDDEVLGQAGLHVQTANDVCQLDDGVGFCDSVAPGGSAHRDSAARRIWYFLRVDGRRRRPGRGRPPHR